VFAVGENVEADGGKKTVQRKKTTHSGKDRQGRSSTRQSTDVRGSEQADDDAVNCPGRFENIIEIKR